jgi:hypothetical protein
MFAPEPPRDWDASVPFPALSSGFAEAARCLGFRPLYAEAGGSRALVLVRSLPLPVLGFLTTRAKVYASDANAAFLRRVVDALRRLRASHIRVGDSVWGLPEPFPVDWPALARVERYLFMHPPAPLAQHVRRFDKRVREHLRRAERAGVTVFAATMEAHIAQFVGLSEETRDRMHARAVAAVYPPEFFRTIFRCMVPRGDALFLLAQAGERVLAGSLYLVGHDRLAQYHSVSTRDRELTPLQGPSAVAWHALQLASERGLTFDMGVVTPTLDPAHPHHSVYDFKRRWGGEFRTVSSGELVAAPLRYRAQERLLTPLWDRLHPFYLRVFGERAREETVPSARGLG